MSTFKEKTDRRTTVSINRSLTDSDKTIPFRFVGSYEYENCLSAFNQLLEISTEEDLKIYDEFLNTRPEFTYFQGLSSAFQEAPDVGAMDGKDRAKFSDQFQKGGLAWMMALAQVEYASTLSMYSDIDEPFTDIVVNNFNAEQYLEVLIDDATAHIKSLAKEAKFTEVSEPGYRVDTWTLAYVRRVKVIKDMLTTISRVADEQKVEELRPIYEELEEREGLLVAIVNSWLTEITLSDESTSRTDTRSSTGRVTKNMLQSCDEAVAKVFGNPTAPTQSREPTGPTDSDSGKSPDRSRSGG